MSGVLWRQAARVLGAGAAAFGLVLGAPPAGAAVTPGDYCVVGLGPNLAANVDGWLALVTPGGAVTDLTPSLTTGLVNPWDCAIDPTNGDVIVVDEGNTGNATNGVLYRVSVVGATVTQTVLHSGSPLINPRGLAVGSDGTIYLGDMGQRTNNNTDGAVYALPPAGSLTRLDTAGVALANPIDVDLDPRPFTGTSPGLNLVILESRGGALNRVPLTGGTVVTIAGGPGGNDWRSLEVGPYGNYFLADHNSQSVQRFDRLTSNRQTIATNGGGSPLDRPMGITVDYYTAGLVVADENAGVVDVPPNSYLGGGPLPTTVAALGAFPGPAAAGIGFSPPLASANPSTNLGVPTRRAPLPGGDLVVIGPASSTGNGDPESELNLFIEVTDTTQPLRIRIFDPNVRDGFDGIAGSFDTALTYTLFDPSGAVVTTVGVPANGRVDLDQRIATLNAGNTLTVRGPGVPLTDAGVYRLLVDATSGDDWHGLGLWVEDFATHTFNFATGPLHTIGPAPNLAPLDVARLFPYFDRGCEYGVSNFDLDMQNPANAGTTLTVTTRLGEAFALTGSGQNVHLEDNVDPSPASPASQELDYGLHAFTALMGPTATQNNIVMVRSPDFNGWVDGGGAGVPVPVPPGNPAANPTPTLRTSPAPAWPQTPFDASDNTFLRHYLPRYDETPTVAATPYAPYLTQAATPILGDPPTVGNPSRYLVQVLVANPDPVNAMTDLTLAIEVPAPALYVDSGPQVTGGATATGGATVTPPCAPGPCSGFVVANWPTVAAGSVEVLSFAVEVTPSFIGERLYLTGGPAVRGGGPTPAPNPGAGTLGTVGFFTPAWSSAAFPRNESLGPLCDLSVVEGTVTPVAVELAHFEAEPGDGAVRLVWETAAEFENLGFYLYRRLEGEESYARITPELILGRGTTDLSARYSHLDASVPNGVRAEYLLEDIELDGDATRHGPVAATPRRGAVLAPLARPSTPQAEGSAPTTDAPAPVPNASPAPAPPGREAPSRTGIDPSPSDADPIAPAVETVPSAPSLATAAVAALPGVKVGLRGPGLTRVEAASLFAAGLARDVDPRRLRIHRQGREVAVRIEGEDDGRLDPGDALLVWSDGIDTRYSDEDVIFVVAGDAPGRRIARFDATPAAPPPDRSVAARARFEEQRIYLPGILNGEGDNFVGSFVFDRPVVSRIETPGASGEAALLHVRLRGGTTYAAVDPDHHFELRVAGAFAADVRFDGSEVFETFVPLDPGIVAGESLEVEIAPRFDSGAPFDLIYVDALELHHRRALRLTDADAGFLAFEADADGAHRIEGLSDAARARLWDVSDPDDPLRIDGVVAAPDAVDFEAEAGARYAIVETDAERPPAWAVASLPSRWSSAAPDADWVAIVDGGLLEEAERLAAHRERQGLRTLVIDVEDAYDEMAGGVFTPVAIRDLVRALAARWARPPQHVLLVGEASYDYRDFLGGRAEIGVPSMLVDTTFVETASDAFFGDLDGDGAPEIAVGRLPARTPEELAGIVDKLIAYEAEVSGPSEPGSWRERLLLVADDGLGAGDPREAGAFEAVLDEVADAALPGLLAEQLRLSELPEPGQDAAARGAIRAALEDGRLLALYAGHGGARVWADELIWGVDDVLETESGWRLPIYLVLNCLNAFFDAPNEESLAEVAVRASDRGAAAFVSSTAVTAFAGQERFAREFAAQLLGGRSARLGEALRGAQQALAGEPDAADVLASFVLIGDPATPVAVPAAPVADPGPDRETDWGVGILLDGTASRAREGSRLSFRWRVVEEPEPGAGRLLGETTATPWFVGWVPGSYRVELTVDDGRRSAPATVRIAVSGAGRGAWGCGSPEDADAARLSGLDFVYLLVPVGASAAIGRRRRETRR